MKLLLLTIGLIGAHAVGISPAAAKSPCRYVGPPREAICVCNKNYCWLEVGTGYRFYARFSEARALTEAGAIGVWRPIGLHVRHARW